MCNDYGLRASINEIDDAFRAKRLPLAFPGGRSNLEPRDDIWPTERAPIVRRGAEGCELVELRWGLDPGRPKAPPVINFRSDGRRFGDSRRCLVPASHFFEFTGAKSPKSKWKFTLESDDWFCFAGLWRPAVEDTPEAFTILTTEPGPDVAPIHNRQVVVLERHDWPAWLDLTKAESELLRPLPAGRLHVEQVR